ncbi:MAG: THUMP domain-containing protein [Bacteroidales bacterium]|jgi:putative N6-adenine-specific DNA methylase
MLDEQFYMVAKTFQGLEEVLAQEIRGLGVTDIEILNRAVRFRGDLKVMYAANYRLRTALKVLVEVDTFPAKTDFELYQGIQKIDWVRYLEPSMSMAVECVLFSDFFSHSQFIAQRTKDAVVDQFRDRTGRRPSVDRDNPDLLISIHIQDAKVNVLLDSSGGSLHRRGYRSQMHLAPINEVLAAGLLLLSGWTGKGNLIDPMCGSGTFLIEGAMIAMNIPPGTFRSNFGFEKWKNFDQEIFTEVADQVEENSDFKYRIVGSDKSAKSLQLAREGLHRAFLDKKIELVHEPLESYVPPAGGGWLITNPPYDERMKVDSITGLYRMIGDRMKQYYKGYQVWIFSGNPDAMKFIGLHPSKKIPMLNGSIECSFRRYDIYEGSKKAKYQKPLIVKK